MYILTIKSFKEEIKNFLLNNYPIDAYNNYYTDYLLFLELLIFKTSQDYSDYNRHIINAVKNNNSKYQRKYLIQDYQFTLPSTKTRKEISKTILTRLIKNRHPKANCKRNVYLLEIMKKDLIDMNILIEEHNVQQIKTKEVSAYIQSIYSLNFKRPITLFENEKIEFEITGNYVQNETSDFVFDINELMNLIHKVPLKKFIRNYRLMMKLNNEGYAIKTIGVGDRTFHNLSYLSKEFRAILIVRITGNNLVSKDIVSSFPMWLSILSKNEALYDDIVSGKIKSLFDKIELLTWFNDKRYMSKKYDYLRTKFIFLYGFDTSVYRDSKGCMYELLAQSESNYINAICKQLTHKHFTIHDQIYIDKKGANELDEAIKIADKKLHFKPIWT